MGDLTMLMGNIDGEINGIRGPQGETGETGNGIASAVLNDDYTLTLNYTDGTSWTSDEPIRGAEGEQGIQGIQGIQGVQGETGATGATPNVTIGTITTLPPGSSATATITGTAENPVLNLGIPEGGAVFG